MRTLDVAAGVIERLAITEAPLRVAVTTALCVVVVVPAWILNCADTAPAGTVTDGGTVRGESVSVMVTGTLELAALVKVTVQVPEVPDVSERGAQASV